ncbi:hypothetical protein NEOLEDRAFT_214157 [Neolentinus lepideus HHB14362 ss-1]|uniref:Uncharacterized protein n=1 Tax=Neolentinus lepideus HHB14362 ss-1 TaxID=1314782 RepID=A0A165TL74_9AGAM|nr:hypothetical protein NEOLEDRAFT_214157 [Neolentinus lepideus HHB14362 ss-1]
MSGATLTVKPVSHEPAVPHSHVQIVNDSSSPRDPHLVPIFNKSTTSIDPILFLPPLLSCLPPHFSVHNIRPPHSAAPKTHLPDIDPASLSLHKTLHNFKPITPSYATVPYAEAFNWAELRLPAHEEREWYCVVFRSRRKEGSDSGPLYEADAKAHEEAIQNGGLIMYWYGIPDPETGMNLATCIWQSRKHAIAANSRPHHLRAMRLAAVSYEVYDLERYTLRKVAGQTGVTVESFSNQDVGW